MTSTVTPMSRSEMLHRRIEWCVGLAAALPPSETKTALEGLARECVRDLLEDQHGAALIERVKTTCAGRKEPLWPIGTRKAAKKVPLKFPLLWPGRTSSASACDG